MDKHPPQTLLADAFRSRLARGDTVLCLSVQIAAGPEIVEIARAAGADVLYVDLEHGSASASDISALCSLSLEVGLIPLVRVADAGEERVAQALALGAAGVIVPHIESAVHAAAALAAVRRGSRPGTQPSPIVILMLESPEAIDHVEEIAGIGGVDVLFIGTSDLSTALGIPRLFGHPLIVSAYRRTIAACRRSGVHVGAGGMGSVPDVLAGFALEGARFLSIGTDVDLLRGAAVKRIESLRSSIASARRTSPG